jgi:hypothetical protein
VRAVIALGDKIRGSPEIKIRECLAEVGPAGLDVRVAPKTCSMMNTDYLANDYDTSAIIAILNDEPECRSFNEAIEKSDVCLLSTAGFVEALDSDGKQPRL